MITRPILENGIAVIAFTRDSLDASNTKTFKDDMQPVLGQYSRILLDLEALQFVDSSRLGAMLSCLRAKITNELFNFSECFLFNSIVARL